MENKYNSYQSQKESFIQTLDGLDTKLKDYEKEIIVKQLKGLGKALLQDVFNNNQEIQSKIIESL